MRFNRNLGILFSSIVVAAAVFYLAPAGLNGASRSVAAACSNTQPPTALGQVSQTVTVSSAGSYRLWTRMKAADAAANSYYFQVDSGCAYNVGDAPTLLSAGWSWVNYQDANNGAPIDLNLTAGTHTFTYTGKEAAVQIDKIMLLGDTGCVPSGLGDNCGIVDTVAPTVSLMTPANNGVVTKTTTISVTATDAGGVSKVEFYANGVLVGTDTTQPYSYDLDTTNQPNGLTSIQAKAYDAFNNVATSSANTVTVVNDPKVSQYNNLLNGKTFTASVANNTTEAGNPVTNINDKIETSRWISAAVDGAAVTTDLGSSKSLGKITVYWAADTIKDYKIQMSDDNQTWKTVTSGVTNNTQRQLMDITNFSPAATGRYFRVLAVDRWNTAFGNSIWEIGAYASASNPATAPITPAPDGGTYLSDVLPLAAANGWGPYERDMSNGEKPAGDGRVMTMNGMTYAKGLGTHAPGTVTYALDGTKTSFRADIGIDDEAGTYNGLPTVSFEVWGDGKQLYKSVFKTADDPAESISVNITAVKQLQLKLDPGTGNSNDKADWANARLLPGGSISPNPAPSPLPAPSPTPAPTPTSRCTVVGDVNCDNRVNAIDLSAIISRDGQNYPAADFNHDGSVGAADLAIMLAHWTW